MKKNISYLSVCFLLIISVLYTSHSAQASLCEVNCNDFPTPTQFPFPTIVFPTFEIPFPTIAFPTPTECPLTPTPTVTPRPTPPAGATPTVDPTATPTPGQGLTHTVGNQGTGEGDGRGGTSSNNTVGQVLGLASTGTFADSAMKTIFMAGIASATIAIRRMYAAEKNS